MVTARELRQASRSELRKHIVGGYPVDPSAIEGWVYRGTSIGLPAALERLSWKTFQKTFYRDPGSRRLLGWNVRLEQDGIDAPSRSKTRRGVPVTEWYYEVTTPEGVPVPSGFDRGLIIDYSLAPNPPGPMRLVKDPLVSLSPDNANELLGVSYAVIAGRCVETPTYFTLEREQRVTQVPEAIASGGASLDAWRLTDVERGWAEALMAAMIPTGEAERLPAFASVDRGPFWRAFDGSAAPLVRAGLRPMLYTLTFLPLLYGFARPFFRLGVEERERFLARAASDTSYVIRQSVTTLKTLACFAYFDDPRVRAPFDSVPAPGSP